MKIYNKSGFVMGILWIALGVVLLSLLVLAPEAGMARLVKNVVLGVLLLVLGVTAMGRACSKQASREDLVEAADERNKLVKLKAEARIASVLLWAILFFIAAGLIGFGFTNNSAWTVVFTVPAVLLIVYIIAGVVATAYYERHI